MVYIQLQFIIKALKRNPDGTSKLSFLLNNATKFLKKSHSGITF